MCRAQQRKDSERIARRRRIQDVAAQIVARRGFLGSSIEEIARAADLSVGSIYRHFRSKEDLCVSLVAEGMTRLDVDISGLRNRTATAHWLAGVWGLLVEWAGRSEYARVLRCLAEPGIRPHLSTEVRTAVAKGTQGIKVHLQDCILAGIASGRYGEVNAHDVAELLWALLLGCLDIRGIGESLGEGDVQLEALAGRGLQLIEQSILAAANRAAA